MALDAVGQTLRQRVTNLLAARTDVSRAEFGQAIRRGHSWLSEFFSAARTTNDLRLVLKMARFFRVPVGYLLNETAAESDPQTLTLLGAFRELHDERDREAVLQLALTLRRPDAPGPPGPHPGHDGAPVAEPRSGSRGGDAPRKRAR